MGLACTSWVKSRAPFRSPSLLFCRARCTGDARAKFVLYKRSGASHLIIAVFREAKLRGFVNTRGRNVGRSARCNSVSGTFSLSKQSLSNPSRLLADKLFQWKRARFWDTVRTRRRVWKLLMILRINCTRQNCRYLNAFVIVLIHF